MMYHEIEQYKMNSFATRVVDMYAKKFESCNEIFRNNNKQEKKKNMPPLLVSLPVYAKSVDEEEYKCLLIENCIMEYGPKEYNPVFEDLLNKKMNNFNDFKKPKRFFSNKAIEHSYIECWYLAIASQKLFKAIAAESYECIIGLLSQMINKPITEYFHWLSNILCKSIIVLLLI